jgi:hypothetical protein
VPWSCWFSGATLAMLSRSCSLLVLFSPLHAAAFGGYQEVVETFLEKNVR